MGAILLLYINDLLEETPYLKQQNKKQLQFKYSLEIRMQSHCYRIILKVLLVNHRRLRILEIEKIVPD